MLVAPAPREGLVSPPEAQPVCGTSPAAARQPAVGSPKHRFPRQQPELLPLGAPLFVGYVVWIFLREH